MGGVNNPGPGIGHPAVVRLSTPLVTPAPIPTTDMLEPPNTAIANYVLLPQPDVFVAERRGATVAALSLLSDRIRAEVALPGVPGLYYELDFTLGLLDVHPADGYIAEHDRFWRQGGWTIHMTTPRGEDGKPS